jgi:hypothetical protein
MTPFLNRYSAALSTPSRPRALCIDFGLIDTDTAASLLDITDYIHDAGERQAKPPQIRSPYLVLVVPGQLVRTEAGWKIARMEMNREFEFAP